MATSIEIIAGSGGFKYVGGTSATPGYFTAIVVNADAVFSAFVVDGVSVMTERGLSGSTIKAGVYLPAGTDNIITSFTLTSGSVIAY